MNEIMWNMCTQEIKDYSFRADKLVFLLLSFMLFMGHKTFDCILFTNCFVFIGGGVLGC
jgi:hypothetical protein